MTCPYHPQQPPARQHHSQEAPTDWPHPGATRRKTRRSSSDRVGPREWPGRRRHFTGAGNARRPRPRSHRRRPHGGSRHRGHLLMARYPSKPRSTQPSGKAATGTARSPSTRYSMTAENGTYSVTGFATRERPPLLVYLNSRRVGILPGPQAALSIFAMTPTGSPGNTRCRCRVVAVARGTLHRGPVFAVFDNLLPDHPAVRSGSPKHRSQRQRRL